MFFYGFPYSYCDHIHYGILLLFYAFKGIFRLVIDLAWGGSVISVALYKLLGSYANWGSSPRAENDSQRMKLFFFTVKPIFI